MAIEYFNAYHSYLKSIEPLDDAERGRLFTACLEYSMTGTSPELCGNERFVFPTIKAQIDRDKSKIIKGENHWNWKGGITPKNTAERNSEAYSIWRNSVFVRDNYTCQKCGKTGGRINAHHIKRFSQFKSDRLSADNGVTLCEACHKNLHKEERCLTKNTIG